MYSVAQLWIWPSNQVKLRVQSWSCSFCFVFRASQLMLISLHKKIFKKAIGLISQWGVMRVVRMPAFLLRENIYISAGHKWVPRVLAPRFISQNTLYCEINEEIIYKKTAKTHRPLGHGSLFVNDFFVNLAIQGKCCPEPAYPLTGLALCRF